MSDRYPNKTPIRLGMKAKLYGRVYTVGGRLVVSMMEDGERYYWDEWQLVAPDGSVLFLEFDEGRWKLLQPVDASQPIGGDLSRMRRGSRVTIAGRQATVIEFSTARVHHVEGTFTWPVKVGDESHYIDAKGGTSDYAVEWFDDDRPVEHYRVQHLSKAGVYAAFDLKDARAGLRSGEAVVENILRLGATTVVMAVLAFVIWSFLGTTGRVVARGSVVLPAAAAGGQAGERVGPFRLEPGGNVHRITVARVGGRKVSGQVERDTPTQVERPEPTGLAPAGQSTTPMPYGALSARRDFKVDVAGDYYVRLTGDTGTVDYERRGGVVHRPVLLGYALLALVAGGGMLMFGSRAKSSGRR